MSGIITTGSKPRLLLPGITELFGMNYKQLNAIHPELYEKKASQRNYEEAVQLVGTGVAEEKGEGAAISVDSYKQGYTRLTQHKVWAKKMRITMEAFEDDLYLKQAQMISKSLAESLFHAKEINAAAIFNNATSTSAPYVGADGKALLASDHPTGSGGTFSNIVTSDLSELALEQAVINIYGFVGSNGLRMLAQPKCLLIPRNSIHIAHRILKSDLRSGTADNDVNALRDMGAIPKIIPWQFLTDSDSWFVLTNVPGLCYYERMGLTPHTHQDNDTLDQIYMMTERYSFDHYDPRVVYGSMGA